MPRAWIGKGQASSLSTMLSALWIMWPGRQHWQQHQHPQCLSAMWMKCHRHHHSHCQHHHCPQCLSAMYVDNVAWSSALSTTSTSAMVISYVDEMSSSSS